MGSVSCKYISKRCSTLCVVHRPMPVVSELWISRWDTEINKLQTFTATWHCVTLLAHKYTISGACSLYTFIIFPFSNNLLFHFTQGLYHIGNKVLRGFSPLNLALKCSLGIRLRSYYTCSWFRVMSVASTQPSRNWNLYTNTWYPCTCIRLHL